jgi:hypothetical protein
VGCLPLKLVSDFRKLEMGSLTFLLGVSDSASNIILY